MNKIITIIRGTCAFLLMTVNTLFWTCLLFPMAFLKLIIPLKPWRKICDHILNGIATNWISVNSWNLKVIARVNIDVSGLEGLRTDDWYLVLSNHQSWSDILVLQKVFNRRIPFLKFFLKQELIYVPVMGMAWWALDYPFMKRFTKEQIAKKPELAGKDLETTRNACRKFRNIPVTVMNFVEGTRFTIKKHAAQSSPYRYLLKPKAAGIAYVLNAMGDCINRILSVTIVYPGGVEGFWGFISGKVRRVRVRVDSMPVPNELIGDYFGDTLFQKRFQGWLNELWTDKDRLISEMLQEESAELTAAG